MKRKQVKKVAKKAVAKSLKTKKVVKLPDDIKQILDKAERKELPSELIEKSSQNYRRVFNEKELKELADSIKVQGLIHDITVRPTDDGHFIIVSGARRNIANNLAGNKTIWAKVALLNEEQAREVMLNENLHRVNPNPIEEAGCIAEMIESKRGFKEIALRLGKSESFVAGRFKLLSLIESFQEMLVNDKITLEQALELATISQDSQIEVCENHCKGWKENEYFHLQNIKNLLKFYTYDLSQAPFDIKNKTLIKDAGSCINCKHNSATMGTIFPDLQKGICTSRTCYQQKCKAHYSLEIMEKYLTEKPQAVIMSSNLSGALSQVLESTKEIKELESFEEYQVTKIPTLEKPTKEEFTIENSEGKYFDKEGYNQAVSEFDDAKKEYAEMISSGTAVKGLFVTDTGAEVAYFAKELPRSVPINTLPKYTSKEVAKALKTNTATIELIDCELSRQEEKREKLKKLNRINVQLEVHRQFIEHVEKLSNNRKYTDEDKIAARLIIYQSLTPSQKEKVDSTLHIRKEPKPQELYETMQKLTQFQSAYLVRMTMSGKLESKDPDNVASIFLYRLAQSSGVDVSKIESDQAATTNEKERLINEKNEELMNKRKELIGEVETNAQAA